MNIYRRRIVAYVAANLSRKKLSSTVYDVHAGHETKLSGEVSPALIAVFDHDRNDYVVGHRKPSQTVSLTDLASQQRIDLNLDQMQFHGLDYETGKEFQGAINDSTVSLFDAADDTTYEYRV